MRSWWAGSQVPPVGLVMAVHRGEATTGGLAEAGWRRTQVAGGLTGFVSMDWPGPAGTVWAFFDYRDGDVIHFSCDIAAGGVVL